VSGRLFAIGDIHGCLRELDALVSGLPLAAGDTVCFVGDYLDRGRDSKGVIDFLLAARQRTDVRWVFLKGNHEDMCLAFLGRQGRWGEAWIQNGGGAAIKSYGLPDRAAPAAVEAAMEDHLPFLESLERAHEWPGHRLVHAGIRPELAWEQQTDQDLFWIREEFIAHAHALPETIVFGHTPSREVLVDLPYKIGIDTGCVYGGALTALELPDGVLHQVRKGEQAVRRRPMPQGRRNTW
jgi:serine/threonine protein phosphatase 1